MGMAAFAHFRQLCCLGLGAQAVMPSLLSTLHEFIPSETNAFFWATSDGQLAGFLPEYVIPDVVATLVDNFDGVVDRTLPINFAATMLTGRSVGNLLPLFKDEFYRGDLYNLIYRPYNLHHAIDGIVRAAPNARGMGALVLGRSHRQPPFSLAEMETLNRLLPYVAHAFHGADQFQKASAGDDFTDSGDSGMVILNGRGQIMHISAKARQVLYLATHSSVGNEGIPDATAQQSQLLMTSVYDNLNRIFQEKDVPAPVVHRQSPWGRFVFRGYWLDPLETSAGALVGVTVQQQEPMTLVMMRKMHAAGLSEKQKEICLLLRQNLSFATIATRLRISHATAKDYADRIYRKLDVHTREEMLQKLC